MFDAYGTLFDVHSVMNRCEEVFPGHRSNLTSLWRAKQLEYTWLRALMGRYEDFWQVTQDGLVFACRSLGLAVSQDKMEDLMQAYMRAEPLPRDSRRPGGSIHGGPCSILSNGCRRCWTALSETPCLEGRFRHILHVDEVRIYTAEPGCLSVGGNPSRHPA